MKPSPAGRTKPLNRSLPDDLRTERERKAGSGVKPGQALSFTGRVRPDHVRTNLALPEIPQ